MKIPRLMLPLLFLLVSASVYPVEPENAASSNLITKDAEVFASLFEKYGEALTAEKLQMYYLAPGSDGIRIFTPYRIMDAANLEKRIAANPGVYQRAVSLCLPVVRSLTERSAFIMQEVAGLIGEQELAPAYVVFGGNNSGGSANAEGLVIGIEVLCHLAESKEGFSYIFEYFIAHEMVHVYQDRLKSINVDLTLLERAIIEGVADFIAEKILGRVDSSAMARTEYGLKNEATLWEDFKLVMGSTETGEWLYQQTTTDGKPADLAYWIGKRIAEAYYYNSEDKSLALRELVGFSDVEHILHKSRYGENF